MAGDISRTDQQTITIPSHAGFPPSMVSKQLPSFDELPGLHGLTGCAWGIWGKDDQLGTVNLLTEEVVAEAAKEIK